MVVVQLLDELEELSVGALRVYDELEERQRVVLPVLPTLHLVYVVAYPVVVADDHLAVHEEEAAVRHDRLAHLLQKHAEPRIRRGEDAGERQLHVVVGAALHVAAPHARQRILERYAARSVDFQLQRIWAFWLRQRRQIRGRERS